MDSKNIKKPARSALGRGLSALISSAPVPVAPHRMNTAIATRLEESSDLNPAQSSPEIALQGFPPIEKIEQMPSVFFMPNMQRGRGAGRPTKKDRRDMNDFRQD